MLLLHVQPARGEPFDHPLEGRSLTIGRAPECDVVLDDRFLSRQHTRLSRDESAWWVEDLGSRNGTWVNGRRLEQRVAFAPGDELRLSGNLLTLRTAATSVAAAGSEASRAMHTIYRSAAELMAGSATGAAADLDDSQALLRHADRLKLLNEVHQALSRPISLDDLLDLILDRIFEQLRPEGAAVFLQAPDGSYRRAACRSDGGPSTEALESQTLLDEVARKGQAALVLDLALDERFGAAESMLASGVKSLLAAPLLDPEGSLGMIALHSRAAVRRFTEEDMELLVSLASVAALRIRNLSLAQEAGERRKLEEEVRLARAIQVALLPDRLPEPAGWILRAGNVPSRGVSGDYYLVTECQEGRQCVLMVADVSGKGISAALLTASLEALTAGLIEVGRPPEEICTLVSRQLHQRTPPARYATAFLAILEPATGRLRYANAGHNPGLLMRGAGDVEPLGATGLPLGLMPEASYSAREVVLEPGDTLILYTDGITEAENPAGEEYGLDRLAAVCRRGQGEDPARLLADVEEDLESFTRGVPFADDRTLVIARRLVSRAES